MIQKESWTEWLENPVTEQFLKYLKDSVEEEVGLLKDSIKGGSILSESEQVRVSTTIQTLERISEIGLEEILDFYKPEE